ncbi:TVP38/TMEM64 family protein [Pontibacter sp. SGAir0037]|uniref:TVP38/TMEM64 family protein n=1 Tax=Pontibacter sp. SGAir0037 TaxID=2571030 RepID=UPI0010CD2BAC|nr:VTT domain-containing protein [Pontibacter sp. SGAir0037]QCR22864.1 hypothetical protein C1N53_11255 [Pontibacter sp. SGAir0037]
MKKLLSIFVFCCFVILISFALFGQVEQQIEQILSTKESLAAYALVSFAFLTSDIFLPVPSSFILILNGKILGVVSGTLLSTVSGVLSSAIGFYVGRRANQYLNRYFGEKEQHASNWLFQKFGNVAIAISKALPILSEAISVVAGTTSMSLKVFLVYSLIGHFFVSLAYAYVGSFSSSLNSGVLSAIVILASLAFGWVLQYFIQRKEAGGALKR